MNKSNFSSKDVFRAFFLFIPVGIVIAIVEYLYFSNIETRAIQAEFKQKADIRQSVISARLHKKFEYLGDELIELTKSGYDLSSPMVKEFFANTMHFPKDLHDVTILFSTQTKPDQEVGIDHYKHFHFFNRNMEIKSPENKHYGHQHLVHMFPHMNNVEFLNVVKEAIDKKEVRLYQHYLRQPVVKNDTSELFQMVVPFNIDQLDNNPVSSIPSIDNNQYSKGLNGVIILTIDLAALVTKAMKDYINTPGGLDFYIYHQDLKANRLMYYHASGVREEEDFGNIVAEDAQSIAQHLKSKDSDYYQSKVELYGQSWVFVFKSINGGFVSSSVALSGIAVIVNLGIIFLLTIYLMFLLRHNEKYEMQIVNQVEEIKKQQIELNEQQEFVRSIVDNVVDGIITIDHLGTIIKLNRATSTIFGYDELELIGKNVKVLMPEPYQREHDGYLAHHMQTGEKHIIGIGRTVEGMRKDGSIFPLELSVSEMDINGKRMFTGIVRDITERVDSERALIEAKDVAERANVAKTEFLSSMSHELRTPLNAIMGYSQMIQYDSSLSEPVQRNVKEINRAGEHLLGLINDVLDLAKVEAGHLDLQLELCEVSVALDQAYTLIAPLAAKHNISLEVMETCPGWGVEVDKRRLKQVFINLISNAIKYNKKNGKVIIYCELISSGQIAISVKDTGLGISEHKLEQLFLPFNRLGAERSDIEGTGIGLSITKDLIEAMGGELLVESQIGKGSIFSVKLPAQPFSFENVEDEFLQAEENIVRQGGLHYMEGKILVAEDNEINQHVISQQLDLLGFHYDIVGDGQMAWETLQLHDYLLLLTDIHMPKMEGDQLVQKIRMVEQGQDKHLPIIAFTADAVSEAREKYFSVGIDDYIAKPVNLVELKEKLERWIEMPANEGKPQSGNDAANEQKMDDPSQASPAVNIEKLQSLVGDDFDQNCKILKDFIEIAPQGIELIQRAYLNKDYELITSEAHKLKSSARTIGSEKMADAAELLEKLTASSVMSFDDEAISLQIACITHEMKEVDVFIADYCNIDKASEAEVATKENGVMSVAVVDDDPFMLQTLSTMLEKLGVANVVSADTATKGLELICQEDSNIDLVFTDLNMPDMDGVELLRYLADCHYKGGVVLISGEDSKVLKASEQLAGLHHLNLVDVLQKPIKLKTIQELIASFNVVSLDKSISEPEDKPITADELALAIKENQLEVYYQPKVSSITKVPLGMEALVRWNHPEKGMIPPVKFISLAEDNGLINELTKSVIQQAFSFTRELIQKGYTLKVSVNISGDSLNDLGWYDYLVSEADDANLLLENVIIEVTESRLMEDYSVALEILTRLTMQNIGISIDDFGTGFSTLEQLQRIPFKELKLDRSFVQNVDTNQESQIILSSTVEMAKNLGLSIVAEGVESEAEWKLIQDLECDMAQGYFIAPPMDKQAFVLWLKNWIGNLKKANR